MPWIPSALRIKKIDIDQQLAVCRICLGGERVRCSRRCRISAAERLHQSGLAV
jgi:hypothetical protein